MTDNIGYGQLGPEDVQTDYTKMAFLIQQALARVRTAMLVQVMSCSNSGAVAAVGTVSVQPLVNMIDGNGRSQAHGEVFDLPYFRMQGGVNGAVIMDPVAGDIGVAVICDRDSSAVQSTKAAANPGTYRKHDISDGLYVGGFLNAVPKAYVQFDGQGNVSVADNNGNKINMNSGGIILTPAGGIVTVHGELNVTGAVFAGVGGADQIGLQSHTHPSNGSPPTPGT
jgi:hypothetical protein